MHTVELIEIPRLRSAPSSPTSKLVFARRHARNCTPPYSSSFSVSVVCPHRMRDDGERPRFAIYFYIHKGGNLSHLPGQQEPGVSPPPRRKATKATKAGTPTIRSRRRYLGFLRT